MPQVADAPEEMAPHADETASRHAPTFEHLAFEQVQPSSWVLEGRDCEGASNNSSHRQVRFILDTWGGRFQKEIGAMLTP